MTEQTVQLDIPGVVSDLEAQELIKDAQNVTRDGDDVIFANFECGHDQEMRVVRSIYQGRVMYSIRRYYLDESTEQMLPGKGVTLRPEHIGDIIRGLQIMDVWCQLNRQD
jgi:hypothetical protein